MARLPRIVLPNQPHVIIHRARNVSHVFRDAADGNFYRNVLRDAACDAKVEIHAYALFSSEVRLLTSPRSPTGLAELMQAIGRRYVPRFNQKYGCTGTPWEGRFRSAVIEASSYFMHCLRFVERSVESRNCQDVTSELPLKLPSSLDHHLGMEVDALVSDHPAFWTLGNTPFERHAAYRRFLDQAVCTTETVEISLAALNGWALGSDAFLASVGTRCGRRSRRATPGRPIKRDPPELFALSPIK